MSERGRAALLGERPAGPSYVTIAAAYGVAAIALAVAAPGAAEMGSLWPASGFFLGLLILTPEPQRARAAIAFAVAHAVAGIVVTRSVHPPGVFAVIVTGQAWLTLDLLRRVNAQWLRFDRLADVGWLFLMGSLVAAGIAGAAAGLVAHWAMGAPALMVWRAWWFREATDFLIITPLVLGVASRPRAAGLSFPRLAEALVVGAALTVMASYIFFAEQPRIPLSVGVMPFMVWAALRFGVTGSSAASLLLWEVAALATQASSGPFVTLGLTLQDRLARTHLYVAVTGGLVLVVAAAIAERQGVSAQLAKSVEDLRRAYTRVQAIIASAPDMIGAMDDEFRITGFNAAWAFEFERLTGVPPSIGLDLRAQLRTVGSPWALAALSSWERALGGEKFSALRGPELLRSDRQLLADFSPIRDDSGRAIGVVQILRDVTEESRRLEAEAQAQRLESVGQLAGGIAHDFNNIVTGILSYAELLEQSLAPDDARRADVVEIERAALRAAELTAQLLAYARRQVVEPRVLDPNEQVEEAERLLRRLVGEGLTFTLELAPGIWPVRIDPASFEQVLVNLAINARDAMQGGGLLRMATSNVTLAAEQLPQPASGAGDYVRVDVSDTGHGMAPELVEHIFEPFFTTKEVGKGTGLGLASVFGILQQFGGAIGVESIVGHGTTFSVYLPRVTDA